MEARRRFRSLSGREDQDREGDNCDRRHDQGREPVHREPERGTGQEWDFDGRPEGGYDERRRHG